MRIIFILLMISFISQPVFSQPPSKQEMQKQIGGLVKELNSQIADKEKQIADAKKNKEDPEAIKEMEDELAMLKKQVATMSRVSKGVSQVSDATYKTAVRTDHLDGVPVRDNERIGSLPQKTLTDAELSLFIQKVSTAIDKKMPASQ